MSSSLKKKIPNSCQLWQVLNSSAGNSPKNFTKFWFSIGQVQLEIDRRSIVIPWLTQWTHGLVPLLCNRRTIENYHRRFPAARPRNNRLLLGSCDHIAAGRLRCWRQQCGQKPHRFLRYAAWSVLGDRECQFGLDYALNSTDRHGAVNCV